MNIYDFQNIFFSRNKKYLKKNLDTGYTVFWVFDGASLYKVSILGVICLIIIS